MLTILQCMSLLTSLGWSGVVMNKFVSWGWGGLGWVAWGWGLWVGQGGWDVPLNPLTQKAPTQKHPGGWVVQAGVQDCRRAPAPGPPGPRDPGPGLGPGPGGRKSRMRRARHGAGVSEATGYGKPCQQALHD